MNKSIGVFALAFFVTAITATGVLAGESIAEKFQSKYADDIAERESNFQQHRGITGFEESDERTSRYFEMAQQIHEEKHTEENTEGKIRGFQINAVK